MDKDSVVASLESEYPKRNIICIPEVEPAEVICELGDDGAEGEAIAVIDRSEPHYHKEMFEEYEVLEGELILHIDDHAFVLNVGDRAGVLPGKVHWAEGDATKVRVVSLPPWSAKDHHPVKE